MKIELDNMIAATRKHNPEALDDPDLRERIARAYTQIELTRLLNYRALSKVLKVRRTGPRYRWPSSSGATCRSTSPSSASTCSVPQGCSHAAGPTR
jgi:hypothetical protein